MIYLQIRVGVEVELPYCLDYLDQSRPGLIIQRCVQKINYKIKLGEHE